MPPQITPGMRMAVYYYAPWNKWCVGTVTDEVIQMGNKYEATVAFDDSEEYKTDLFDRYFVEDPNTDHPPEGPKPKNKDHLYWTILGTKVQKEPHNKRAKKDAAQAGHSKEADFELEIKQFREELKQLKQFKKDILDDPALKQMIISTSAATVHAERSGVPRRNVALVGNSSSCRNYAFMTGHRCPGLDTCNKYAPIGDMISYDVQERLRKEPMHTGELFAASFKPTKALTDNGVCVKCIARHHDGYGIVITKACSRKNCIICMRFHSNGKKDWTSEAICCGAVPMAENGTMRTFLTNFFRPYGQVIRRYEMTFEYEYNAPGNMQDHTVDLPVVFKENGQVVAVVTVEMDTDQHAGYIDEGDRLKKIIRADRDKYGTDVSIGVIHFNMQGKFTTGGKSYTDQTHSHVARWIILRNWLLDFALNYMRYPKAWALYLFYSDVSKHIVWPLNKGVCGVAFQPPKDIRSMGNVPTKADWSSALIVTQMRASFKGEPQDIKMLLLPENCVERSRVFGANFGPDTKPPGGAI